MTLFSFENTEDIVYENAEDSFVSELNDEWKGHFSSEYSFDSSLDNKDGLNKEICERTASKYFEAEPTAKQATIFTMVAPEFVNFAVHMKEDYPL